MRYLVLFCLILIHSEVHAGLVETLKAALSRAKKCEFALLDAPTSQEVKLNLKNKSNIETAEQIGEKIPQSDADLFAPPLPIDFPLPKSKEQWLQKPYFLRSKIMVYLRGEHLGAALHKDFYNARVKYLNDEERIQYRVFIVDGVLKNFEGEPLCPNKCKGIFVMSPTGEIYFSDQPIFREFHHSSFLAGQPAAAAGELKIENGVLLSVNNRSGHYRPTYAHVFQFLLELKSEGVKFDYKIEFYDLTGNYMYDYREKKEDKPLRKASLKRVSKHPEWARRHIGPVPWEMLKED